MVFFRLLYPSLNLIIEIKSSSTIMFQGVQEVIDKCYGTLAKGFNYIMIVNKNYSEFDLILKNSHHLT
jgi:hypothetical protein